MEKNVTVYGVLLAGGKGVRSGAAVPKQFVEVKGKPIIYYTIKGLLAVERLGQLYIAMHQDWVDYSREMVDALFPGDAHRIHIVLGGKERQDSVTNAIRKIQSEQAIGSEDILLVQEAARPFSTAEMYNACIDVALEKGCAVCGSPAIDTMFVSRDGQVIDSIPPKSHFFHGQNPACHRLQQYIELENRLPENIRRALTSDVLVWTENGLPLHMAPGSPDNFKITTPRDLKIAELFLED